MKTTLSPSLEGSAHTPRFIHDCDHCKFLGQYFSDDLYFCDYGPATVIARFGNDGHEYSSGLGSTLPNLQEAERRALAAGYLITQRLLDAAPDLLEALKGVLRVADRATIEFDAARAAIKKATS